MLFFIENISSEYTCSKGAFSKSRVPNTNAEKYMNIRGCFKFKIREGKSDAKNNLLIMYIMVCWDMVNLEGNR